MSDPLRVLFATSECAPWSKTGGLADVSAALPAALRALGADVRVLTPAYKSVPVQRASEFARIAPNAYFPEAHLLATELPNRVPALLVDCPDLYARPGGPYQTAAGEDWGDNAHRFGQLCRIAAALATEDGAWRPDIVHCNDWQTALVPVYLRYTTAAHAATVQTVHNLAFQGLFPPHVVAQLGLPAASYSVDGLEFYGRCSFLKGGLAYADALTTVSPTYAREIQSESQGMGLQGLLQRRSHDLTGILCGIDTTLWDPASDPHIARRYNSATLADKIHNKHVLQERTGLPQADLPLLAMVSRLTDQKGIDWVIAIAEDLVKIPVQLMILGHGDARYESALRTLAELHPAHVSATFGFDESLAHLIEAGADAFLMPSRFEPCGMNQMYSQRYGTVPIVRATGGLVDSVESYEHEMGTGFVFQEASAAALFATIKNALAVYRDNSAWRRLQLNGMHRDFRWEASARRYLEIYRRVASVLSR